jgi:hypothetical protein
VESGRFSRCYFLTANLLRATTEHSLDPRQPQEAAPEPEPARRKAGPLQVAAAVFWSFLGIRKNKKWQQDAASITPVQAIVGGLIGALLFVLTLLFIVHLVTS